MAARIGRAQPLPEADHGGRCAASHPSCPRDRTPACHVANTLRGADAPARAITRSAAPE